MADEDSRNWGQQAARLSWPCVLLALIVATITKRTPQAFDTGLVVAVALLSIGGLSALLALVSMPWCGLRRVFLPAILSLLPVTVVVFAAVPAYIAATHTTHVPLEVPKWRLQLGGEVEAQVEGQTVSVDIPPDSTVGTEIVVHEGDEMYVFELQTSP